MFAVGQNRGMSLVEFGEECPGLEVIWILPAWDTDVVLNDRESAAEVILESWSSLENE